MKVSTYITIKDIKFSSYPHADKILPTGSFVKPMHQAYVPKHCLETLDGKYFRPDTEVFAYCHFGIQVLNKADIRKVD